MSKFKSLKLNKPLRNIGIDFDDVLHDFNESLYSYHNKKYGTSIKRNDVVSYDIEKIWGGTKDEAIEKVYEFYRTREHDETMPLDGSVEVIRSLAHKFSLHIITSRVEEIKDLTIRWLDRHFPDMFSSVVFVNHYGKSMKSKRTKAEVCSELYVDLMIEDSLEHALAISACGIPVILIDCPWNQGETPDNVYRVRSWKEIGSLLLG
jgi:uncharacterized HAD superfamily protein